MRVLEVIHGFPPRYNAGSELYTQTISEGLLVRGHNVSVFCRQENPFEEEYGLTTEEENGVKLYIVNHFTSKDKFRTDQIEKRFEQVLDIEKPDIVHIGHLSHLSTGLPEISKRHHVPVIFTLHDYWLACPRGQFLQVMPNSTGNWPCCPGQEDKRCAERCYSRTHAGSVDMKNSDMAYWTSWIHSRMSDVRKQLSSIDMLVSPSMYLRDRIIKELGVPTRKIVVEHYGFDHHRLNGRIRNPETSMVFGYIGRIIAAKGINDLINAFGMLKGNPRLRIWGENTFPDGVALKKLAASISQRNRGRIEWCGPYRNTDIVESVLNRVDVVVVPSIWDENSPLVIQEALHARVPVIAPNHGGMGELVRDGENGLTYPHRDMLGLYRKMQYAVESQNAMTALGSRGNLYSIDGKAHPISNHVMFLEGLFRLVLHGNVSSRGVTGSEIGRSVNSSESSAIGGS